MDMLLGSVQSAHLCSFLWLHSTPNSEATACNVQMFVLAFMHVCVTCLCVMFVYVMFASLKPAEHSSLAADVGRSFQPGDWCLGYRASTCEQSDAK